MFLERNGAGPVQAVFVTVTSSTEAQCFFWGLVGSETGKYDVVVKNPDGFSARLYNGFEVKAQAACGHNAGTAMVMGAFMLGLLSLAGSGGLLRRRTKRSG